MRERIERLNMNFVGDAFFGDNHNFNQTLFDQVRRPMYYDHQWELTTESYLVQEFQRHVR